ncbi:MAG: hypothetical protein ACTSVV_06735 [Promethearchaeota archaeon]
MDYKYDLKTQQEINSIISHIKVWKNLFSINLEYFVDGWALYLREKTLYPRLIVVFKNEDYFSIKSFEIHFMVYKETYKELYKIEKIYDAEEMIKELKAIIYGKDVINSTYQKYLNFFG